MNWRSLPLLEHNPGPASHWPTVEIAAQEFDMLAAKDDVELEFWLSAYESRQVDKFLAGLVTLRKIGDGY